MKTLLLACACLTGASSARAQNSQEWLAGLAQSREYVQKRASSYDRTGGNADFRRI